MCGNEQFSYETCHPVYLELGFNFQILFQSHIMLRLYDVAESELSDEPCSLCLLSPTSLPCRQAIKRVLHYMMGLESQLCYGVMNQETALWRKLIAIFSMSLGERQRKNRGT